MIFSSLYYLLLLKKISNFNFSANKKSKQKINAEQNKNNFKKNQNFSFSLFATYLSCEYTLPGGVPMIKLQSASLAALILAKLPIKWMVLSARIIRVLVAFYIAFLVLPFSPEIRAIQRAI
jgi:hypothetical protein